MSLRRAGLGLLVGAVLHLAPAGAAGAQDSTRVVIPIPTRPDSIKVDTTKKADTLRVDTVKTPLARSETPVTLDAGGRAVWDRTALFASGALTVADLLDRIPGFVAFRTGYLATPIAASYDGDIGRVRFFYDGIELDPIDPRAGDVFDLNHIQLWTLEEVAVERSADEMRVYMRSWRVQFTTPNTRTDVLTGDDEMNLYRGFYGRRFGNGAALQAAAEQMSVRPNRTDRANGDLLSLFSRLGWARGKWSVDGFINRSHETHDHQFQFQPPIEGDAAHSLPTYDAQYTLAYVRGAWGQPDQGLWVQAIASEQRFAEQSVDDGQDMIADSSDTTRSRSQYVFTGGYGAGPLRFSATDRFRVWNGNQRSDVSARASMDFRLLSVAGYAEQNWADSTLRTEASALLSPFPWFAVSATAARRTAVTGNSAPDRMSGRAEAALRVRGLWLGGGAMFRDTISLTTPIAFDTVYVRRDVGLQRGAFLHIRGPVWKSVNLDLTGVVWDTTGFYTPRIQVHNRLYVSTDWLHRFPSGNFSFLGGVIEDYRTSVRFPTADGWETASPSHTLSTLMEIRIVNAVISWQFRNFIGVIYSTVPGYAMPRQTNIYGVRWQFWN